LVAVLSYILSLAVFIWCSCLHVRVRLIMVHNQYACSVRLFPYFIHQIIRRTVWKGLIWDHKPIINNISRVLCIKNFISFWIIISHYSYWYSLHRTGEVFIGCNIFFSKKYWIGQSAFTIKNNTSHILLWETNVGLMLLLHILAWLGRNAAHFKRIVRI
jgi:hypothetical protein